MSARRSAGWLAGAGTVLLAGVAVCVAVAPRPIDTGDGMSWFGVTRATLPVYAATLLVAGGMLLRAGAALGGVPDLRPVRLGLWACAALLPVLLATPFTVSPAFDRAHMSFGSLLFVLQLVLAGGLWWGRARTPPVLALLGLQVAGGLTCFAALFGPDAGMLAGQLVFQAAFTACVALALARPVPRGDRGSAARPRRTVRSG